MKSVKLIIVTVVFLVVSAQAERAAASVWRMDDPDPKPLCVLSVHLGTPSYAAILNQGDLSIHLEETTDVLTYEGCTDFKVICLFDVTLSCKVTDNGKVPGDYSCWIDDENVPITGDIPVTRTVCVKLKIEKLPRVHTFPQDLQVATVTLTVSPRI